MALNAMPLFCACRPCPAGVESVPMTSCDKTWRYLSGLFAGLMLSVLTATADVKLSLADGFDFPVGKPNADGYFKARGLRLREPQHFGEDWNGRGGGDTDLGDPVYAVADGIVTFAHNVHVGWGNVILTRHAYRDSATGQVKFIDTLNGHLNEILVKEGQVIKRGMKIGTIGNNFGMYPAHLHFEMRNNIHIGMQRNSFPADMVNWADPTTFINAHRQLNREWSKVAVPTGTYQEYEGFKGL